MALFCLFINVFFKEYHLSWEHTDILLPLIPAKLPHYAASLAIQQTASHYPFSHLYFHPSYPNRLKLNLPISPLLSYPNKSLKKIKIVTLSNHEGPEHTPLYSVTSTTSITTCNVTSLTRKTRIFFKVICSKRAMERQRGRVRNAFKLRNPIALMIDKSSMWNIEAFQ